jgi:N-acetylneuraminic acid mutarotase
MISARMHSSEAIRSLFLVSLFAIVLAANAAVPAFAGTSGTWANTGSLNTTRAGHSATLLPNGQVLVAGGEGATGFLNSAELYDPSQAKWTVTGSMATSRLGHSAALLPNGPVLVAGGIVNITDTGVVTVTATAELYNPCS